jgi:integrase
MSYFTGKSRDEAWEYFHRHLAKIPLKQNHEQARKYLLEKEEYLKLSTMGSYLGHIKAFGIHLKLKPWLKATRDDVFYHIKGADGGKGIPARMTYPRKPLGKYSKYQRMVMLRDFYKWLLDTDETPEQFKRLPFKKPTFDEQSRGLEAKISKDEVLRMLTVAGDEMDRALIMLLLDSGFRSGEASALDLQDVEFDEYGALIQHHELVEGLKTGVRKVKIRITFATRYVRKWMEKHPDALNPDAPLFISRSHRNHGDRLSASAIWEHVSSLARDANIRHIHPHMFRHSCVSEAARSGWGEEMMRLRFGWSKGSPMPSHYSHVEDEFDNYSRRQAGLPMANDTDNDWNKKCGSCGASNRLEAVQCKSCLVGLRGN